MSIAMRDLDIRGAGDLLGADQSGFISEIGIDAFQKILDEAIQELKETEFKELFKEEIAKGEFVKECHLETDFEIIIPSEYVNEITERLSLYRELDNIEHEEDLKGYEKRLIDRFGEVPSETHELMNAIRLRWLAKDIGFEKLVLKKNILIGTFITDQNSVYYQSNKFTKVLNFIKSNPHAANMAEKKGKLRLRFDNVSSVEEAINKLTMI